MLWRSVVTVGSLQLRVTRLPLRLARRSFGGLGSSSDGGSGGPSWAQLASSRQSVGGAMKFISLSFIRNKKEYQRNVETSVGAGDSPARAAQLHFSNHIHSYSPGCFTNAARTGFKRMYSSLASIPSSR